MSDAFKRFEQRLLDILKQGEQDKHAIGVAWNELCGQRYAQRELHITAKAWWKSHKPGSYCEVRTAERLGRVAKHYDADTMAAEGDSRLDDLLSYCHLRHVKPPKEPGPTLIEFKTPDGQKIQKPFSQCNFQEMDWAAHPQHPKKTKRPPPPTQRKPRIQPDDRAWHFLGTAGAALHPLIGNSDWEHGAAWEDNGNQSSFSLRRIPFPKVKQALDLLQKAYADFAQQNGDL
jgi:hypothetical protein